MTFGTNALAQSSFTKKEDKVEFDWNGNPIIPGENWKEHAKKRNSDEAEMGSASDTEEESVALSDLQSMNPTYEIHDDIIREYFPNLYAQVSFMN